MRAHGRWRRTANTHTHTPAKEEKSMCRLFSSLVFVGFISRRNLSNCRWFARCVQEAAAATIIIIIIIAERCRAKAREKLKLLNTVIIAMVRSGNSKGKYHDRELIIARLQICSGNSWSDLFSFFLSSLLLFAIHSPHIRCALFILCLHVHRNCTIQFFFS